MAIKHERPSQRRMMLQFDRQFLDFLPIFKRGFDGNEIHLLYEEVRGMGWESQDHLSILDVGSADGDWLHKTTSAVWETLDRPKTEFTALEPIVDNPGLSKYCQDHNVTWVPRRVEESELPDASFDVITCTHAAYYFYNQPLAHEELWRLLKPNGKLIVTLVSQYCVLNLITHELLRPHRQFSLTAESYISLMAKLGLFTLEKVASFKGGYVDNQFFKERDENLRALGNILARHRLREGEVELELDRLSRTLQIVQAKRRLNLVMFFSKADINGLVIPQEIDTVPIAEQRAQLGTDTPESAQVSKPTQLSTGERDWVIALLVRQARDPFLNTPQEFFQDLVRAADLPGFAGQWRGDPGADASRLIQWVTEIKTEFPGNHPRSGETTLGWLLKALLDKGHSVEDTRILVQIILDHNLICDPTTVRSIQEMYPKGS